MLQWRFTTTSEGNLATHVGDDSEVVAANRLRLATSLGIEIDQLRWMNQVHGNHVALASPEVVQADGLVTDQRGIALAVLVADCIPLLLSDEVRDVVAAVHVGRRGLVNGVAVRAVEEMRNLGAKQIRALVGPAICGACYEVPLTMQQEVLAIAPAAEATSREGTPALDIRAGLVAHLTALGVEIEVDARCTRESEELFSYRRDDKTGRFAGVIMVA